jgi:hypothetical protein
VKDWKERKFATVILVNFLAPGSGTALPIRIRIRIQESQINGDRCGSGSTTLVPYYTSNKCLCTVPVQFFLAIAHRSLSTEPKWKLDLQMSRTVLIFCFIGEFETLLTTYHYYVGCGNEVHNAEDKLTEICALQQGVEVGYHG